MFKKVISTLLALVMLLSIGVCATDDMLLISPMQGDVMPIGDDLLESPVPVFSDVLADAAYKSSIDLLVKNGVLSGYPDGTFRPLKAITRAEMCKIINLAFGYVDTAGAAGFPDLVENEWYVPYVLAAQKAGYIKGDTNGNFRPLSNITREEVCTILYRIIKPFDLPVEVNITDNVSEWAKTYVDAIVKNAIMPLEEGGKFRATEMIKRFELAVAVAPYSVDLEKISCVVTFGEGADEFTQKVVIGAQMAELPEPKYIPKGMNFIGWSLAPDEAVLIDSKYVFMGDTQLYPVFGDVVYTVQFLVDGALLATQKVAHGESPELPYTPGMVGYLFTGWAVNGMYDVVDIENFEVTSDTVFNAVFEPVENGVGNKGDADDKDDEEDKENGKEDEEDKKDEVDKEEDKVVEYTITFVSNGKTVDTQKVLKDKSPEAPEDPILEGYIFLHWAFAPGGAKVDVNTYAVKAATVFFAVFEKEPEPEKYTVKFMADSKTVSTQTVFEEEFATAPEKPSKKDHIFKGWSLEEDGELVSVSAYAITEDTVFYAVFEEIIPEVVYYDVTFKVDSKTYDDQSIEKGKFATLPVDPAKTGYIFLHWSLTAGGNEVDVESYAVNKATVFYAVFEKEPEPEKFTVNFVVNASTVKTQEVIDGKFASAPADPIVDGYKFMYWSLEENGRAVNVSNYIVTEDTTFYAVLEEIKIILYFDVTFISEGDVHEIQTEIEGGTSATLPDAPEKIGHDFLYWSLEENGSEVDVESYKITEETTFYAVFALKENPNDPEVIKALEKTIKGLKNTSFRTGEERDIKKDILTVMGYVYADATENLILIDSGYVQREYSVEIDNIRGAVTNLDDNILSQFISTISNSKEIDDESFDILTDYFLTEEQKDQLLDKMN